MAKYGNGTNYAKTLDPTGANQADPGVLTGKVRVMQDTATISASSVLKSNDYIIVGDKIPTGAQVLSVIVASTTTALSTNNAIVVGDEGDDDRYIASIQLTTSAVQVGPTNVAGCNYVVTGITDNYIRVKGATNPSIISTGAIKVTVLYSVE